MWRFLTWRPASRSRGRLTRYTLTAGSYGSSPRAGRTTTRCVVLRSLTTVHPRARGAAYDRPRWTSLSTVHPRARGVALSTRWLTAISEVHPRARGAAGRISLHATCCGWVYPRERGASPKDRSFKGHEWGFIPACGATVSDSRRLRRLPQPRGVSVFESLTCRPVGRRRSAGFARRSRGSRSGELPAYASRPRAAVRLLRRFPRSIGIAIADRTVRFGPSSSSGGLDWPCVRAFWRPFL